MYERIIFLHLLLCCLSTCSEHFHDYIIVGAGPAGLQLGYFLQTHGRDYVILERSNISGNFFSLYPRHGTLISINKRFTGHRNKEFNLRHDWNSLLSHDESLQMKYFSKELFPPKEALLKYLDDFQRKLQIYVKYDTDVGNVEEILKDNLVQMTDQNGNVYKCRTLVVATGLWKPNRPKFTGENLTVGYEEVSTNPDDFEGKSVLILGKGNSAFEVADRIYGSTNAVHMLGRSRVALSWETHYVGDVRAINNGLLDTYQLKSLDGVAEADIMKFGLKRDSSTGKIYAFGIDQEFRDNFPARKGYDMVIRALGWNFDDSLFKKPSKLTWHKKNSKKFPAIDSDYRVLGFNNIYMAGVLSHSLDYRKSAGGFIHGYRYTAQTLHNILELKKQDRTWPRVNLRTNDVMSHILKRINEASGLYQMFSVLSDVVLIDLLSQNVTYFENFPVKLISNFTEYSGVEVTNELTSMIVIVFQYGTNFSGAGKDVFYPDRANTNPSEAHLCNFLHPVLYHYKRASSAQESSFKEDPDSILPRPDRIHHMSEDFLTEFNAPKSHILPLRRFLEKATGLDLRTRFAEDCMRIALTYKTLPYGCQAYLHQQTNLIGHNLWHESQTLDLPL